MFKWLEENHPDILESMLKTFDDEKWSPSATKTRRQSLNERYEEFKKAK